MQSDPTKVSFAGQHIYAGIDVARRSWKVCIYLGQSRQARFSQPPEPKALVTYLKHHYPGATYHSVYEAGCFGFWIHRELTAMGVDSIIIHAADVPTTDKERRTKTDRVDAAKLARALAAGILTGIFVPDRQAQEDRTLVRARASFVQKQTRTKCQLKAMLRYYGLQTPENLADRHWSRRYVAWLEALPFAGSSGQTAFHALLAELLALRATIASLSKAMLTLSHQERYREPVELLLTVSGISLVAAMTFLTEIVSLERFKHLSQLLGYIGLVPGEHSTGETEQDTGLTPRRNAALRFMLIECAWVAVRQDPALREAFEAYARRMPKSMAIVHIAHKLVSRMRYVLKHREPYVPGVVATAA